MPDSRLQQLQRSWRASDAAEDEAAYLRQRVRVGELALERLQLAANCGHTGARLTVGGAPHADEPELGRWVYGLRSWGTRGVWPPGSRQVYRLAAWCAAEAALGACGLEDPRPRLVVDALEVWASSDRDVAPTTLHRAYTLLAEAEHEAPPQVRAADRVRLARALGAMRVALSAFGSPAPPNASAASAAEQAALLDAPERVRGRIAERLIDWALG
ncbi:MAG: hypothetical protein KDD82_26630 [Planctomycetes bacterium]|nr:hypothetical protein [Planctomycetota bacterium]